MANDDNEGTRMKDGKRMGLVAMISSAALLGACGGADNSSEAREKQMEAYAAKHGIDIDVESAGQDGEKIVIKRKLGPGQSQIGKNLDLPDDFPDDVAMSPKLRIHGTSKLPNGHMLQGQFQGDADTIASFYAQKMPAQGWSLEADNQPAPTMRRISYRKGSRIASLMLVSDQDGATTTVQLGIIESGKP